VPRIFPERSREVKREANVGVVKKGVIRRGLEGVLVGIEGVFLLEMGVFVSVVGKESDPFLWERFDRDHVEKDLSSATH